MTRAKRALDEQYANADNLKAWRSGGAPNNRSFLQDVLACSLETSSKKRLFGCVLLKMNKICPSFQGYYEPCSNCGPLVSTREDNDSGERSHPILRTSP